MEDLLPLIMHVYYDQQTATRPCIVLLHIQHVLHGQHFL